MGVEPLPAGLWRQTLMLPWILARVTSLVSALQYVHMSWSEKQLSLEGVHCVEEDVVLRSSSEMEDMMMFLIRNVRYQQCDSSPSPGQIVQSLTLASAGDNWNMERLEILGKMMVENKPSHTRCSK